MSTLKRSLLCLLVLSAISAAGCPPRERYPMQTISPQTLADQLGMTVARADGRMVVLSGSRGTIVFNPQVNGVMINRKLVPFDNYRPIIYSDGQILVPADFVAACDRYLKPGAAVATQPTGNPVPLVAKVSGRIVIDPGHGGRDPGATGISGTQEKWVNLRIGKLVAAKLQAAGCEVTMTRDDDSFIDLEGRPATANRINADAFVALHADSSQNSSVNGFTIFVCHTKYSEAERAAEINGSNLHGNALTQELAANRSKSMRLAQCVRSKVMEVSSDRGIQLGPYRVLKQSVSPAILIETGFMSNPLEERQLNDSGYQDSMATAIANGILAYLAGK